MVKKRIFCFILCIAMVFSLTACGQQEEESSATRVGGAGELVYVPEYISLEGSGENSRLSNFTLNEDFLYYVQDSYNEAVKMSSEVLYEYSLEDGSVRELPVEVPETSRLTDYTLDKDGNIYVMTKVIYSEEADEDGSGIRKVFLCKYDSNGKVVFEKDITEAVYHTGEESFIRGIVADEQNHIYIGLDSGVLFLNDEGEEQGMIEIEKALIRSIVLGQDGKVYICYTNNSLGSETVLSEIQFKDKNLGETYHKLPSEISYISIGTEQDFLICDRAKVYGYTLATETYEELFSWLDYDIDGSNAVCIGGIEKGGLAAVVSDWDTTIIVKLTEAGQADNDDSGNSILQVEAVEKEEIVIGIMSTNYFQELQSAVTAFNLASEKYHASIKVYRGYNNEISYEDAITNINKELISGSNCPDILELSGLNIELLAAKGYIEDLTPYLEKSSVFDKDDFVDNLLDGFTYDGILTTIPPRFYISTVVGKTSNVGEEMGWTVQEMMELAEEHPDSRLFATMEQSSFLYYYMMFNGNTFVDWSAGECHFDSEEFRTILEFAKTFPSHDELDQAAFNNFQPEKKQADEILLETIYRMNDFNILQMYPAIYGEEVTFVGFPTMDGSVGCVMEVPDTLYGVTSRSDHKDGAWEFIESYLEGMGYFGMYGFPVTKDKLQEKIDNLYHRDANGEIILDENGEPSPRVHYGDWNDGDWEYSFHMPTEEEIDLMLEIISVAKPQNGSNSATLPIELIIYEEAEAYFSGQKTLDEVVEIIQNRVQNYVSENS